MDKRARQLLERIERTVADLRAHLNDLEGGGAGHPATPGGGGPASGGAAWDAVDWARRQRPEWEPRGRLMHLLAEEGGRVSFERWKELGEQCGYRNGRGMNGFFAGNPSVVSREGDDVVLSERGYSAAAYWRGRYGGGKGGRDA